MLDAARKASQSSTDQGQRFERLCRAALTAHDGPDGTQRFSRVWLWNESWPHKKPHDNVDTGIDLVAEQADGTLAAIQCKFCLGQVSTSAVGSFLAARSRVGWLVSESRRQAARYARSVSSRFNDAAQHESPWKRLLWRGLIVLEAVVVAVLLTALVAAVVVVALAVALMVLVVVAVAAGGGNKRRRRRLW